MRKTSPFGLVFRNYRDIWIQRQVRQPHEPLEVPATEPQEPVEVPATVPQPQEPVEVPATEPHSLSPQAGKKDATGNWILLNMSQGLSSELEPVAEQSLVGMQ